MKLYLAGPMRGIPNFNFPAFDLASKRLRDAGFEVFSPADHDRKNTGAKIEDNPKGDEDLAAALVGFSIRDALSADCTYICQEADGIAMLPGWERSRGANAEKALAEALGLTVIYLGREFTDAEYESLKKRPRAAA